MHQITLERQSQWRFAFRTFLVGFAFFVMAMNFPDAMKANVFGLMAYDIPAETWSAGFMGGPMLVMYGLHINGRWFWSPMLRAAGYMTQLCLFSLVGLSALTADDGAHLVPWVALFFIPEIAFFLRISFVDMRGRFARGVH